MLPLAQSACLRVWLARSATAAQPGMAAASEADGGSASNSGSSAAAAPAPTAVAAPALKQAPGPLVLTLGDKVAQKSWLGTVLLADPSAPHSFVILDAEAKACALLHLVGQRRQGVGRMPVS